MEFEWDTAVDLIASVGDEEDRVKKQIAIVTYLFSNKCFTILGKPK